MSKNLMSSTVDSYTLYTFGFGADHDATALNAVAKTGNGMFYFIDGVDKVGEAFGNCLGGILSLYATKVKVTLSAVNGAAIGEVLTEYSLFRETATTLSIIIPDMFSDETKDIPFYLHLPAVIGSPSTNTTTSSTSAETPPNVIPTTPTSSILCGTLEYFIPVTETVQNCTTTLCLNRADLPIKQTPHPEVDKQRNRIAVTEALKSASTLASQSSFEKAQQVLKEAEESISRSCTSHDPSSALLSQDLARARSNVGNRHDYESRGHQYMEQQRESHSKQRATHDSSMYKNKTQSRCQMEMEERRGEREREREREDRLREREMIAFRAREVAMRETVKNREVERKAAVKKEELRLLEEEARLLTQEQAVLNRSRKEKAEAIREMEKEVDRMLTDVQESCTKNGGH